MRNSANHAAKRAGFTLIELLVVVAIIAVIAAILFPVFATVRERGRRTTCQSNLKQIALAMQQYVQESDGIYPPDHAPSPEPNDSGWQYAVYPYVKDTQVFCCPDSHNNGGGMERIDYDYFYARLNTVLPPVAGWSRLVGARESSLATPATIYLNSDACWMSNVDGKYQNGRPVPRTSCGHSWAGSTLHSGGGNWSYADGHVKWLTPEDAGEVECLNGPLPPPFKN